MTSIFVMRSKTATPVWLVKSENWQAIARQMPKSVAAYARAVDFEANSGELILAPDHTGSIHTVLLGIGAGDSPFIAGKLVNSLPAGIYEIKNQGEIDPTLIALGIGFDDYKFDRYLNPGKGSTRVKFVWPKGADRDEVKRVLGGVFLTRDLINLPASEMGPGELASAARTLAREFGAKISVTKGDQLLADNFPMVHAVGRASSREPRLIDMTWGQPSDPRVTLVGKGVCYDTGGLSMKLTPAMFLMKKDMAGGASVLGLAAMIMKRGLGVRLRVIIPAVENSVSGDSYRPGDVLRSRDGLTVEVTNTDAEGRLVLADALTLADEESPDLLIDMATLTGASKVGLGADLPALFCDNDEFAREAHEAGIRVADPVWRMPLWKPYLKQISSEIADLSNMGSGPFGDGIHAGLFLQKFVKNAKVWAHLDLMSWNGAASPGRPFGGEAQAVRAMYEVIKGRYGDA